MTLDDLTLEFDGLHFPECPRWHDGKLWFSDIAGGAVYTLGADKGRKVVTAVAGEPGGLGWDTLGNLLIVSCTDNRLLRLDPGGLTELADLSAHSLGECNDMLVDGQGRAYIGHHNGKLDPKEFQPGTLLRVDTDGSVHVVAEDMLFPNGAVLSTDGKGLIIAESFGRRLSFFTINEDGSLAGRRAWAEFESEVPDGICIDSENAVWVANPLGREVIRVLEGGEVVDRIEMPQIAPFACELGGNDGRTLFICAADGFGKPALTGTDTGAIYSVDVQVPRD